MKSINKELEKTMSLRELNEPQALNKYLNGHDIYVRISDDIWMQFNIKEDGCFPKFDKNMTFYIDDLDNDVIIVTRHKNVVDYFNSKGIYGKVMEIVRPDDVIGKTVYGTNLPLHIISFAKEAYIINIQNTSGKDFDDMTAEDIENCYHQIRRYKVDSYAVNLQ